MCDFRCDREESKPTFKIVLFVTSGDADVMWRGERNENGEAMV